MQNSDSKGKAARLLFDTRFTSSGTFKWCRLSLDFALDPTGCISNLAHTFKDVVSVLSLTEMGYIFLICDK